MVYLIHCLDKPDHLQVRLDNRDAHLAYLDHYAPQVIAAGPLISDEEVMQGSVLIMDFPDRAAVEAFCAEDPYQLAGLFERVHISRWKQVLPAQ